ncbi:MAG: DsbA family protein [Rhodospirillaceae bacterium]|nr:DsbA family protein [Rhodospirillaceae bacterium]MBT5565147.1 DsbA family protein [Rhodospirillaceae bacterium]MBT6088169.1 DsbA family protein [Rhodospirillaceae bacterium]MBT7451773.1 DsbA family protein [Rhodospirillaceae bacterium]
MKPFASAAFGCAALMLALVGTASCAEEEPQDSDVSATQSEMSGAKDSAANTITDAAEEAQQVAQADDRAVPDSTGPVYREMIYGDPAAPVTIVEYASLTCSHCASFHNAVLPELKKTYIDTGKVRLVFRDFPLDGLAMAGAMLARCADGDRGKALISVMFRQQGTWVMSERPIEPLTSYAKLAGLNEDDVNACLENENIMTAIREGQEAGSNQYKIASTPTFFIDDVKVEGNRGYDYMSEIIEEKLEEKGS